MSRKRCRQTLANLEIVFDMLKRYNKGLGRHSCCWPQGAAIAQTVAAPFKELGRAGLRC